MNEAPDGVRDWRKCLSCGMRWDPNADALETVKRAFEEWQPEEEEERVAGDGDDHEPLALDPERDEYDEREELADEPVMSPLDLAMKDVLVKRGRKKREDAMPKFVSEEHRERWIAGQKLSRKLKREAAGGGQESMAKKRPGRPRKVSAADMSVPPCANQRRCLCLALWPGTARCSASSMWPSRKPPPRSTRSNVPRRSCNGTVCKTNNSRVLP